jgi:hypothetical protein
MLLQQAKQWWLTTLHGKVDRNWRPNRPSLRYIDSYWPKRQCRQSLCDKPCAGSTGPDRASAPTSGISIESKEQGLRSGKRIHDLPRSRFDSRQSGV